MIFYVKIYFTTSVFKCQILLREFTNMVKTHYGQHHLHTLNEIIMIISHFMCLFKYKERGTFLRVLCCHTYRTFMTTVT